MKYIEPVAELIGQFQKLPGVGAKTAARYAYAIINMSDNEAEHFSNVILTTKKSVHYCSVCGNFTNLDVCEICRERDKSVICVVKEPKDVNAFEKCKDFNGVYHVLHGTLNPIEGIGPNEIRIKELLNRLDGVKEIIIATNPDVTGDATAIYISRLIKPMDIKVTRIARGIPSGTDIEYADEVTLSRALKDRTEL